MTASVSFVVTCFNQEDYIAEAIRSCLDQTVQDVEVVVVDDGSSDRSPEIIEKFLDDSRVRFIRQQNEGPSAAFNAGVRAASGDFIAWLGGDDVCLPDRVEHQLHVQSATGADVLFCIPDVIDSSGRKLDIADYPIFSKEFSKETLLAVLLSQGNFLCAPSAFMSRTVFSRIGELRRGLIQLQDFEYWIRCLLHGLVLHRDDYAIVQYRRHGANLSSDAVAFAASCEFSMIVGDALDNEAAAGAIRQSSSHLILPASVDSTPLSTLDKVLFMLSHRDLQLKARGAGVSIRLFEEAGFRKELEDASIRYPAFLTESLDSKRG